MSAEAIAFLKGIAPRFAGEILNLAAIHPVTGKPHYLNVMVEAGSDAWVAEADEFISRYSGTHNLYFGANSLKQVPENGKAAEDDVGHLLSMSVDCDPASPATALADMAAHRARLAAFPLKPSFVIDTGRGIQAFWLLRDRVHVNGTLETLKTNYTERLAKKVFSADSTFNLDRLMRLPGTMNRLSKAKRAKGFTETRPARIEEWTGVEYSLADFDVAFAAHGAPSEEPPAAKGKKKTHADTADRSKVLLAKIGRDIRKDGLTDPEIHARHQTDPHVLSQENEAARTRAIQRAIDEVRNALASELAAMNAKHALVTVGKDALVMRFDPELAIGDMPELVTVTAVKLNEANHPNPRIVDDWLRWPERRTFTRMVFKPGAGALKNEFNLFRGWPLAPMKGDCSRQLAHIRDVICGGDESLYEYVVQWLADIIQNPAEKPGTVLTLYGGQGIGKGELWRILSPLFGAYGIFCAGSEQLLGKFNDYLANKLLVVGDESALPGDARGIEKFKSYITDTRQTLERKGVPCFSIDVHARFILFTNRDRAAAAEFDDRRFVVLPMGRARRDDFAYWKALAAERANGGSAALMHHLLNEVALTRNLRSTPKSAALAEQKLQYLDPIGAFWHDALGNDAHSVETGAGLNVKTLRFQFGGPALVKHVHGLYEHHARRHGARVIASDTALGIALRKFLPGLEKKEVNVAMRKNFGLGAGARDSVWFLPSLDDARALFEKALGQPVPWPEVAADDSPEVPDGL